MEDKRNLNLIFSKNGSGRVSGKLNISKLWMDEMGVTEDDKEVIALFKNDRIIVRRPMKEKRYILINDQSKLNDMVRTSIYDSSHSANQAASEAWNSLSEEAKKMVHIYIADIRETDLVSDAFDDDGEVIDWAFFKNLEKEEGLFDSEKLKQ